MSKVLINIYIEDEQKSWLASRGKPAAETIREAIESYKMQIAEPDEAIKLANTMYPGMSETALQQRIRQDWLHDRLSGGKRQSINEIKEGNGRIQSEVDELKREVKALRFMVESLIEKLTKQ